MKPNTKESFTGYFDKARKSAAYWEERAILAFTEKVLERLDSQKITKTTLAERLGVSLPYVTKLIGGSNNFTLRTMVKVAHALGARLRFTLENDAATAGETVAVLFDDATDLENEISVVREDPPKP